MSAVLAATGLAVLLWPRTRTQERAHALGAPNGLRRRRIADPVGIGLIVAPAVVLVCAGMWAAIAASMAAAMAHAILRSRRRDDESAAEQQRLLAALEIMIGELRVGAHPAHACRQAADDGGGGAATAEMLRMMAGRAALGGDVAGGIAAAGGRERDSWRRVAVAWGTAEEFGLPMAELLASARADLLARQRFRERTKAALAGAKATALVLALLPLLGIGLGQAMGASPFAVLLGGGLGGILLVTGVALVCGGLLWSRRIVGKAASL